MEILVLDAVDHGLPDSGIEGVVVGILSHPTQARRVDQMVEVPVALLKQLHGEVPK
jgi:hypothetical protein